MVQNSVQTSLDGAVNNFLRQNKFRKKTTEDSKVERTSLILVEKKMKALCIQASSMEDYIVYL